MITYCNVWPKTTLLLPVWSRDTKRLDAPARELQRIERESQFKVLVRITDFGDQ